MAEQTNTSQSNALTATTTIESPPIPDTTTQFTQDAPIQVNKLDLVLRPSKLHVISDQTLSDFMAKPFLMNGGSISTSQTANTLVIAQSIAAAMMSVPQWTNKIQGFNLVRGTAVVRIIINASPFQQGKFLLHFLPCATEFTHSDASYVGMHNVNLTTKTQQPSVTFDCRESGAELRIPYITPSDFYAVKEGYYDWGSYYLSILAPLKTGAAGQTTIDYRIYLWFEDFEFAAPVVPQSLSASRRFSSKQIPRAKEGEAQDMFDNPMSTALSLAPKVAASFLDIPVLSSLVKPATWVANAASGLASAFGWAKPQIDSSVTRVSRNYNPNSANANGADASLCLGILDDNAVTTYESGSFTNQDEMSFEFLKRIPAYVGTLTWTTSQAEGTSLLSAAIGPAFVGINTNTTHAGHTAVWTTGPPIFHLCNNFAYWRGSITLTIKIAKTDFHTGRLQVTFTPVTQFTTSPTPTTSILSRRHIIDIRTGSEITLHLPFEVFTKYLDTSSYSGYLDIQVLNELRCPETCAQSVDILTYYSGGPDFELALPGAFDSQNSSPFYPQMNEQALADSGVGGVPIIQDAGIPSQFTIGEQFTSLKQLISRNSRIIQCNGSAFIGGFPLSRLEIWPFFQGIISIDATTGSLTVADIGGDALSNIGAMFAFRRGSVRLTFLTPTQSASTDGFYRLPPLMATFNAGYKTGASTLTIQNPDSQILPPSSVGDTYALTSYQPFAGVAHFDPAAPVIVRAPYYSQTHMSLNFSQWASAFGIPADISTPCGAVVLGYIGEAASGTAENVVPVILRSAGDDFQFSYFVGCPPMLKAWS